MTNSFSHENQSILKITQLKDVVAGFSTKNGGVSKSHFESLNTGLHVHDDPEDVINNRRRIADFLSFPLESWVCAEQTHKDRIKKVSRLDAGKGATEYLTSIQDTDGLYTGEKGLLLVLCYADCVPIYFYDHDKKLVGVVHAGWKGTVANIAGKMIQRWKQEENSAIESIQAVIGPSICENCYVVDDYVVDQVNKHLHKSDDKPYEEVSKGQYRLDLKKLNRQLLLKAGLKQEQIHSSSLCTSCHSDLFFSHRRDRGKTGRMMSFIGLKEES
ncbi:peptidoglycan editing factor PgeF [Metabacillus arenae]|uniref:Purine nucleoside phosphorylase n=1 Tax=Metabacillus arenae TaxID=2771434 RepID=A0A926NEU8_9BACI|nr:peptidoglycan editing factor PgeF [Metabacillus arenae]MBD1379946.1 peptidoglycan editing factor PgeF [Metabacillus arenae]